MFSDDQCEVTSSDRGVWYEYEPLESGIVVATISDQEFEARLSLFGGSCNDLRCIGNAGPFVFFDVVSTFSSFVGQPVRLLVSGSEFIEAGNFQLDVQVCVGIFRWHQLLSCVFGVR